MHPAVKQLIDTQYWMACEPGSPVIHLVAVGTPDLREGIHTFTTVYEEHLRLEVLPDGLQVERDQFCFQCFTRVVDMVYLPPVEAELAKPDWKPNPKYL